MIEVFVRSSSVYMDVETAREMTVHTHCAPQLAAAAYKIVETKFKDRVLPEDDYTVLQRIWELAFELREEVKVYDISSARDRVNALKHGIMGTPTVIVRGKKYEGLDKILELLP